MNIYLTYISQDLRVVVQEVRSDGTVGEAAPLICEGDEYGAIDDPSIVRISASTEHEGVYFDFAQGSDPGGAPAFQYVEDVLLLEPRTFYKDMVKMAKSVPDAN